MSRPKRGYKPGDEVSIRWAIQDLKAVLSHLKGAGAKRTADKVRRAIKSAGGAERYVLRLKREQEDEA